MAVGVVMKFAGADLRCAERDEPAVLLNLAQQLLDPGSRGAPPQVRDTAGLSVGSGQQRVELAAAVGRQLITEKLLDVPVRVGPRSGDHARERVDGRT